MKFHRLGDQENNNGLSKLDRRYQSLYLISILLADRRDKNLVDQREI